MLTRDNKYVFAYPEAFNTLNYSTNVTSDPRPRVIWGVVAERHVIN